MDHLIINGSSCPGRGGGVGRAPHKNFMCSHLGEYLVCGRHKCRVSPSIYQFPDQHPNGGCTGSLETGNKTQTG